MTRPGRALTLSLNEADRAALTQLAQEFGMMWGDKPNISKLIETIARRELTIAHNNDWQPSKIRALTIAIKALIDAGKTTEAEIVAQMLLARSELTIPLRAELIKYLDHPIPPWRQKIDELSYQHRPFRLTYRDAADRPYTFTVLFGKIQAIEKRQYLTCQCVESEGNDDVPGLQHNWFLRLDRIQNAVVVPMAEKWDRNGLAIIPVEFHLTGGLAFAYTKREDDLEVTDLETDRPTKRVIRKIHSTFWFFREILPYGDDCVVVAPDAVVDRFSRKVRSLAAKYEKAID
ncbi:MAG: WYL domain-containing protein [Chamaesiphon sp.]|nr:WYL domain-containing protein [Chamaesiphon sp.]